MSDYNKREKLLKALAEKSRLQILDCIQKGIANPGNIAKKLDRNRSTVEKHLKVLLNANIVEKVPSLTKEGYLCICYKIRDNANELLSRIQEACQKF
ncbi:winged helix-turn-helix transcriptional regulator [Candidatus Bathyarchaeota archaeon]|nr:winged helix-turn-helix transcriptional regulator [Candidatus Bathyarchaeota archaeon]